jgi:uncharacterized membrane protein YczE
MLLYRADQLEVAESRSRRALRRLALILDPLTVGRSRRALTWAVRIELLAAGAVIIAVSVAVMLWNDLGAGPLDVFIGAFRSRTGLPLTFAVWITIGVVTLFAWALGRRPGLATIVGPLGVGPTMQLALTNLERFQPPDWLVVRVAIHLLAVGAAGIGAGAVMASRLGQGPGELLALAASDRSGRSEQRMRLMFEAAFLAIGGLLGGPIGLGTVLIALCIGPSVARGRRTVAAGLDASRRQLSAAYWALPR